VLPGLSSKYESLREDAAWNDEGPGAPHAPACRPAQEGMVDVHARFLQAYGVSPAGWYAVEGAREPEVKVTTCDIELVATAPRFVPIDRTLDAPYLSMAYDIETLTLDPSADKVIQIGVVFARAGVVDRHLVALGRVAPIPDVTVHECECEADVLRAFRALVVSRDPDVVLAYNGVTFDANFLNERAQAGRAHTTRVDEFFYLSRFAYQPARFREVPLRLQGQDMLLRIFDLPGRTTIDPYVKFRRELNEPSYKLDYFAKKFCGTQKDDMDYREIPVLQRGSDADRARLGAYCVQDCVLLHDLDRARSITTGVLRFAKTFGIVPEWVYFRGQQVRFVSMLLRNARTLEAEPLLLNRPDAGFSGEFDNGYAGATVNEPRAGWYGRPVGCWDWHALYPTVMIDANLCPSTCVSVLPDFRRVAAALPPEDVRVYEVSASLTTAFVTARKKVGITPQILLGLLAQRKLAKERKAACLARADDASLPEAERESARLEAAVHDAEQLAVKTGANSMYGAYGAREAGKYPCMAVSATVTHIGRQAMVIKKEVLAQRYGADVVVVYGDTDSVMLTFNSVATDDECLQRGFEVEAVINEAFRARGFKHMHIEFEKWWNPYLLFRKKRYAGKKFEPDGATKFKSKGYDFKGIENQRRDALPFLCRVQTDVLRVLLDSGDAQAAMGVFAEHMRVFQRGEVPIAELTMKKALSSKVVDRTDTVAHARVNALRRQREPGSEEGVGGYVSYVFVRGAKGAKATELADDPEYVARNNVPLNLMHYFQHAVREPISKIFAFFPAVRYADLCDAITRQLTAQRLDLDTSSLRDMLTARPAGEAPPPPRAANAVRIPLPPATKRGRRK
jgi:DNA polymerase delta subunit 1